MTYLSADHIEPAAMPDSSLNSRRRAAILTDCADIVLKARQDVTIRRLVFFDEYVVKFNQNNLEYKADTQAFVYEASRTEPNAPRVPKVIDFFSSDGMQYFVMERVKLPTVKEWVQGAIDNAETQTRFEFASEAVANALRWLFTLSPPAGTEIGLIEGNYTREQGRPVRMGSGCSRHPFFGRDPAPLRYSSPYALQLHINRALRDRPRRAPLLTVNMKDEPLSMVPGKITQENFLIDPNTGHVTIIDFGGISVLPRSFVSFTLHLAAHPFVKRVADFLDWERSENLLAMSEATWIYWLRSQGGNGFGLDKDGLPLTRT